MLVEHPLRPTDSGLFKPGDEPINWIHGNPTKKGKKPFKHIDTGQIKWHLPNTIAGDERWILWNPNKQ